MPNRVVIDTNLLISFLINKSYSRIDHQIKEGSIRLLFSDELLLEFIEVVNRPKLKKYFSKSDVDAILSTLNTVADLIQVTHKVDVCRDSKDNFLLALCEAGKANFLLTGDKDLLTMKKFGVTKILTISEFLNK